MDDRVDGVDDVAARVEDRRGIARADAEGRSPRAVGRLHHAGTARREDDVHFLHEEVRLGERRLLDPGDDVLRSARLDGGVKDDLRSRDRAVLGPRMGADDDAVARLEREERLEDRGRGRVGGRNHRADDADRLGELLDAHRLVLLDDAARLRVLVGVVDVFRRVVILDHLVLDDAHARLGNRHLRQRDALAVRRKGGGLEDLVHLLLRVRRVRLLRRADTRKRRLELRHLFIRLCRLDRCILCHSLTFLLFWHARTLLRRDAAYYSPFHIATSIAIFE